MKAGTKRWFGLIGASFLGAGTPAWSAQTATIVPSHSQVSDREAELTYARILSYRRETWTQSIAVYERLLRAEPGHEAALAELLEMRSRTGEFPAAEAYLRAALQAHPSEPAVVANLAKLLLWTGRPAEASDLLTTVSTTRNLTPAERVLRAQALTRTGRHAEANRLLEELLAATGQPNAETLSAAADTRLALGDTPGARDLYRRALAVDPTLGGAQRGYALTLAWTGDQDAARPRLEEVLRTQAEDDDLIHAYVRTLDASDGLDAALAQVRTRAEKSPRDARWRAEWAELETRRGHAVRARQLFQEALDLAPSPALKLRAGRAAITWGDFYGAERILREALERNPGDVGTRDELGRLLVSVDRTEEADQFYERWLLETPTAEPALLGIAQVRLKEKDFAAALLRCEALLQLRPGLPAALRLKQEILAAQPGGPRESVQPTLSSLGAPGTPAAQFASAGRDQTEREDFLNGLTGGADRDYRTAAAPLPQARPVPESAARLTEWAGLYARRGDYHRTIRCLQAARMADPEYFPAWLQLAEFLAIDARFDAALAEFAALQKVMPENRQVLLGEARALAWGRRYEEALQAYERLSRLQPLDPVPRREAARTAGWSKQRERGAALYSTIWQQQPVDRRLAAGLRSLLDGTDGNDVLTPWRTWSQNPQEEAEPFAATERFAQQRHALREALPAARRARLDALYIDLLVDFRLQRAWWLENSAKQFSWDRQYSRAESTWLRLLVVEPGNEEALFDLSQVQASQGLGEREHATLARLLQLDANHSLATHAVRRREIRSRPVAQAQFSLWRERGRGELASLQRTSLTGELQDTYRDQFNVRVAGFIGRDASLTRPGYFGFVGYGLDADGVIDQNFSGSVGFLHREYADGRVGHADTGQIQLRFRTDSVGIAAGLERREEVTNEFGLLQGIRSDHAWLGGNVTVNRRLELDGRLTRMRYSDANQGNALVIRPAYTWTDHPRVFKTILTLEYRDTDQAATYLTTGGRLTNIVHPYWTPQNYTHAALTLEWFRDLATEFFVGSQEHYYDLRTTFGIDSESNPAATLEADWHREWQDRWIAHAGLYVNFSREWDATGLRLRLARRF